MGLSLSSSPVISEIRSIWGSRNLLWNLTLRELRSKYRRSFLGWTWSLLNPLSTVVIFSVVFGLIFNASAPVGDPSGIDNFAVFLLTGVVPWGFFSMTTGLCMSGLVSNSGLVKKVAFSRESVVLSQALFAFVQFLIEMCLVVVLLAVLGSPLYLWIPVTLLMMVCFWVFTTGLGLALSVAYVYFRDLSYLWTIVLQLWFFGSAIMYDSATVEDNAPTVVMNMITWNPTSVFVRVLRDLTYHGGAPAGVDVAYCVIAALLAMALGLVTFRKLNRRVAEEI